MAFRIVRRPTAGTNRVDAFTNLAENYLALDAAGKMTRAGYLSTARKRNDILRNATDEDLKAIGKKYYGTEDLSQLNSVIAAGDRQWLGDDYDRTPMTTATTSFGDLANQMTEELGKVGGLSKLGRKRYGEYVSQRDRLLSEMTDAEQAEIAALFYSSQGYTGDGSDLMSFIKKLDIKNLGEIPEEATVDDAFQAEMLAARRRRMYGGLIGPRSLLSNSSAGY